MAAAAAPTGPASLEEGGATQDNATNALEAMVYLEVALDMMSYKAKTIETYTQKSDNGDPCILLIPHPWAF